MYGITIIEEEVTPKFLFPLVCVCYKPSFLRFLLRIIDRRILRDGNLGPDIAAFNSRNKLDEILNDSRLLDIGKLVTQIPSLSKSV